MKQFQISVQRFFKKLHFFDWIVFVGIAVIIVFFFYLRAARKTDITPVRILFSNNEWSWMEAPPVYWLVDEIRVGEKAYDSLGREIATVSEVSIFDAGGPYRNAEIVVNLAVTYDAKTKTYSYNYQPLQVGRSINLAFEKGSVRGVVMQIGSEEVPYVQRRIKVQRKCIFPEVAAAYHIGDQAVNTSGEVLATIEAVTVRECQEYEFSSSLNRNVFATDPDFRTVDLVLNVKTFQNGPTFYYLNNAALKVGNEIWFEFPSVSTGPSIITEMY